MIRHAIRVRIPAGEHGDTTGRADAVLTEGLAEQGPAGSQRIDVGRAGDRVTERSNGIRAELIRHKDDEVRAIHEQAPSYKTPQGRSSFSALEGDLPIPAEEADRTLLWWRRRGIRLSRSKLAGAYLVARPSA